MNGSYDVVPDGAGGYIVRWGDGSTATIDSASESLLKEFTSDPEFAQFSLKEILDSISRIVERQNGRSYSSA